MASQIYGTYCCGMQPTEEACKVHRVYIDKPPKPQEEACHFTTTRTDSHDHWAICSFAALR